MFCRFGFEDDKPAGGGAGLIERGVQAVRPRIDQRGQRVHVGAFQLRELPVLQNLAGDFVIGRQAFQHIRRGGNGFSLAVLHGCGQIQFFKQDFSELLRRIDVERLAGQFVDLGREPLDDSIELSGEHLELHRLNADAGLFHACQHACQRQIDLLVDFAQAFGIDFGS